MLNLIQMLPNLIIKHEYNTSISLIRQGASFEQRMAGKLILSLVFTVLLFSVESRLKKPQAQRKTIVESNHYFSNEETTTTYDIENVVKGKPLIFTLKKKEGDQDSQLTDNPKTITLTSGSKSNTCELKSYDSMCVLQDLQSTAMKVKLSCKKLPCELSWLILQPGLVEKPGQHSIDSLGHITENNKHAILMVSCNSAQIKDFPSELKLYTTENNIYQVQKSPGTGVVFYLFNNAQNGYYYLTSTTDAARKCANISLRVTPSSIKFNSDQIISDFLKNEQLNVYKFADIPSTDFRLDSTIHTFDNRVLQQNITFQMSLVGVNKDSQREVISKVNPSIPAQKSFFDFSISFKKIQNYKFIQLQVKANGTALMMNVNFIANDRQQVELGQTTYFTMKKSQKMNYKLVASPDEPSSTKKVYILTSDERFKSNVKDCAIKTGCQFTIEAEEAGFGYAYIGEGASINQTEIVTYVFENSITKKIKEGDIILLQRALKSKQAFQVVVNSPNVIIHVASKEKCPVITDKCYEKALNSHNPIIYEPKGEGDLFFKVQGLDNTVFTLTVIPFNGQFVNLNDSVPFTYLMDDKEDNLIFTFKLEKKEDVTFNLIAPVGQTNLLVANRKTYKKQTDMQVSGEGFIQFEKSNIEGLDFVIKVEKKEEFKDKFVHFTIIATTKSSQTRLEVGTAHYQTMAPKAIRNFIFEFDPKKDFLINCYSHNVKGQSMNINLKVSSTNNFANEKEFEEFTIDKHTDVLDLNDVKDDICGEKQKEVSSCEVFLRLENEMNVELDLTLTLMSKDAIIELKDGIWQNYQHNKVAATSHFYFLPKHQNKSVTIFYKSSYIDLKVMYSVWQTDDTSINPAEWPFPTQIQGVGKEVARYSPTKFIVVGTTALKECWPNCVILVSLVQDGNSILGQYTGLSWMESYQSFSVMASNNYIELPQKVKVDIALKHDEQKHILIDLKYILEKDAITIFTYFTIGSIHLTGNVYSQKNPRCPAAGEGTDFNFGHIQTQISVKSIKNKLSENEMQDDNNPYICILAKPYLDSKFSIEYTSENDIIKQLTIDSYETADFESRKDDVVFYQVDASQEFYLKVARQSGFPFISTKLCRQKGSEMVKGNGKDKDKEEQEVDLASCLQEFKADSDKGKQIVDKTINIHQPPCSLCILFVKITRDTTNCKLELHLQSKYTEIELAENKIMTDSLSQSEENRYTLTVIQKEETIINVQILQGDLKVTVQDFNRINITKTNKKGEKVIQIVIPPPQEAQNKTAQVGMSSFLQSFSLSKTFNHLHVAIQSTDLKQQASYTITYSSGEPETYLQDGLISEYGLPSSKQTKFLYHNAGTNNLYLHISLDDATALNKLKVRIYSYMGGDVGGEVEYIPEKQDFKKKTVKPTMIMALPGPRYYQIKITNPTSQQQTVSIGVNNQQIIYLPLSHSFPFELPPKDHIYILINVVKAGYLRLTFNKCFSSEPNIAYTLSYDDFMKEDMSYESKMSQELMSEIFIRIKEPGVVYVRVTADEDQTILVAKAEYSEDKMKAAKAKAGDKGIVSYQLLDSKNAEVSFSGIVCASGANCKDYVYSLIESTKMDDIYAQLMCPGISFDTMTLKTQSHATAKPISSSSVKNNKITYSFPIKDQISYVGIKAENKFGEVVFYKPVEIITLWGQITRVGSSHAFGWAVLFVVVLIIVLIGVRKWTKRGGYRELNDSADI